MTAVIESYIEIDENRVAWIADTRVKVIEVALDKLAHGSSPEEIHFQHPHLSMAQVQAALSFYYAHREELEAEILQRLDKVNKLAANNQNSPLQKKLRELKNQK
ncbi:MAG: DUF433 domain-containing protein [Aridibacter sp.]